MKQQPNASAPSLEKQLLSLEARICEGVIYPPEAQAVAGDHLFGRSVQLICSRSIAPLAGWSAAGLRSAALLRSPLTEAELRPLIRQKSPVVILIQSRAPSPLAVNIPQFVASNAREAIDFSLIAHRIAEYSLGPVIVLFPSLREEVSLDEEQVRSFLKSPDEPVDTPTPAQELLFGRRRRRIPQLHNLDLPVATGMKKTAGEAVRESAAHHAYFQGHIHEIISDSLKAFEDITGRAYSGIQLFRAEKAEQLILSWGQLPSLLRNNLEAVDPDEKKRIGLLGLSLFHPFPGDLLEAALRGKKRLLLLQPLSETRQTQGAIPDFIRAFLAESGRKAPELIRGYYPSTVREEDIRQLLEHSGKKEALPSPFYLGITFSKSRSSFPQHEVLLQAINRSYPGLQHSGLSGKKMKGEAVAAPDSFPPGISDYLDQGPPYTRLSRFLHDTAIFYQQTNEEEQVADPFQALPVTPPVTAGLAPAREEEEKQFPLFLPESCTACGLCTLYCPHTALPSLALNPEQWIRGGMELAAKQKRPVSQLTPHVKKLAQKISGRVKEERSFRKIKHLLPDAFEELLQEAGLTGEKEEKLREAGNILSDILEAFPVAKSQALFSDFEEKQGGSGSLFSLLVDPDSCTGCGICSEVCPDKALIMKEGKKEDWDESRRLLRAWEDLPDTPGSLIQELVKDKKVNPFGALFLSRNYYFSLRGSREGRQLSAKVILHLITGFGESIGQARSGELLEEIDQQIKTLSEKIHKELSDALPSGDFSGLLESLKQDDGKRRRLDQILDDLGQREPLKLLDTETLSRRSELAEDLKEWRRLLLEGPTGNGRARFSLAFLSDKWDWASDYPWNPFSSPVYFLSEGPVKEQTESILFGQIRHQLDNIRLLRRAQLEAKGKYIPQIHDPELASLSWESLEEKEKRWIAPLLLVADERSLDSQELLRLLNSRLPLKIFVLDSAEEFPGSEQGAFLEKRYALPLQLALLPNVQGFGGSLARVEDVFAAMLDSWQPDRPALFHLHAPASDWAWPQFSQLALASRAFPHYRIKSEKEASSLASRIALTQNPEPEKDWASDESGQLITFAHWLFNQEGWEDEFTEASGQELVPLQEYLQKAEPAGKKASLTVLSPTGEQQNWIVSEKVIRACRTLQQSWQNLREMAGLLNPYPEKILEKAKEEASARYEAEIEQLKKEYEEKLKKQEEETLIKTKQRLKQELLKLTKK